MTVPPGLAWLWRVLRPLDPLRSIRAKLGLLVVLSVGISTGLIIFGLRSGARFRWVTIASALACILLMLLLTHGLTQPLRQMTEAARAMASGDYTRRVRPRSRDEVGELAATFNRMAEDLQSVDQHRRELVANVSHELRTPVAALRAVLENVVDGVTRPDDATMQIALAQTERLGRLVTQLLDLSRVDSGAVPLALERFEVREFLQEAARQAVVREEARRRPDPESPGSPAVLTALRARVEVRVTPHDLTALADRERLHQVIANLLDNAHRHSPEGGLIRVEAERVGAGPLVLRVQDDGPGIPPEERTRVFERFTRGATATAAGPGSDGGTGLGLAIARWVVELHGGRISVAETTVGCCIRVELPRA
ncbi:sensor histidine kinase [Allostreptomyces psammosilenae]|uniref:Signal transduction histidine-protein kinase/phosphatase MprB n=1 Tax=Allostreptomyces psammosilenae TaxID=1892865 RepID=A0A853A078_9ACTN|nr:ATP-binding protein [Allostreptomyces psammosilenae]NYI06334.1 signal transduction histidine kinase [Allostreptomyces psammosilenae]